MHTQTELPEISTRNLAALQAFHAFEQRTGFTPNIRNLAEELGRKESTARQHIERLTGDGFLSKSDEVHYRPWKLSALGKRLLEEVAAKSESDTQAVAA